MTRRETCSYIFRWTGQRIRSKLSWKEEENCGKKKIVHARYFTFEAVDALSLGVGVVGELGGALDGLGALVALLHDGAGTQYEGRHGLLLLLPRNLDEGPVLRLEPHDLLDHELELVVALEDVAHLLAVGVLALQLDEGLFRGVVAHFQPDAHRSQPLVRLDHLLLRLSACKGTREKGTIKHEQFESGR